MIKSGTADLPLHNGKVPYWLYERMGKMGRAIIEAVITEYGTSEVIRRLSDPFWFQALGSVMGMDWHSSGITTSVLGTLKSHINPISDQLGIYFCGGRGKQSRKTPLELENTCDRTGLDGKQLARYSRLTAKVDNTAIQDGFQIYLHSFVVSREGNWAVVQQGMNDNSGTARRYHWHSGNIKSFVEEPHTAVVGESGGEILNLTDRKASPTRQGLLDITNEHPDRMLKEIRKLVMPPHHDVRLKDVDMKRLGSVLALAFEKQPDQFETLLLTEGLGPRTIQSLTLVSEVIYGTPSRFKDPARFSFAHGGKDGHPFPVPTRVYDESIRVLRNAVDKAKVGQTDKIKAVKQLHTFSRNMEQNFIPGNSLEPVIEHEMRNSEHWGGRTVFDDKKGKRRNGQLGLFD